MQSVRDRARSVRRVPPGTKRPRRGRAGEAAGRIRVLRDSDAVFEAAIRNGVLSGDPANPRYAGHYMYLCHDAGGTAWFKHRDSRVSVTMRPVRTTHGALE